MNDMFLLIRQRCTSIGETLGGQILLLSLQSSKDLMVLLGYETEALGEDLEALTSRPWCIMLSLAYETNSWNNRDMRGASEWFPMQIGGVKIR